jgi:hypothetical protein
MSGSLKCRYQPLATCLCLTVYAFLVQASETKPALVPFPCRHSRNPGCTAPIHHFLSGVCRRSRRSCTVYHAERVVPNMATIKQPACFQDAPGWIARLAPEELCRQELPPQAIRCMQRLSFWHGCCIRACLLKLCTAVPPRWHCRMLPGCTPGCVCRRCKQAANTVWVALIPPARFAIPCHYHTSCIADIWLCDA